MAEEEKDRTTDGNGAEDGAHAGTRAPWEDQLDTYPLRDASDDPPWAVRVVRGWIWFACLCLVFILTLTVLGFFYH